jgi:hypothetical protein
MTLAEIAHHDAPFAFHPRVRLELPIVGLDDADAQLGRMTGVDQERLAGKGLREAGGPWHDPLRDANGPTNALPWYSRGRDHASRSHHDPSGDPEREQPQGHPGHTEHQHRPYQERAIPGGQADELLKTTRSHP